MLVKGRRDLVYFAFPKCASEWMRKELGLWWRNIYDKNDWSKCDIDYCHIQPSRFLHEKRIHVNRRIVMFTIIRNTYDRLVSAWRYGIAEKHEYAASRTFREFIEWIYENRDRLTELQCCWMYLPMDVYFGGDILGRMRVFQMDDLGALAVFLKDGYGISVNVDNVVNKSKKDADAVYDVEMLAMVREVYSYEIERFGYVCGNVV
jgi:hypothetical protein